MAPRNVPFSDVPVVARSQLGLLPRNRRQNVGRLSWLLCFSAFTTSACGADPLVTYDAGPGWTRSADALRLGPAEFALESYGRSRCVNTERPEGLLGTGLVPGAQDVDTALTKVLREGLLPRLFGLRSMAVGGTVRGTPTGRGATIVIIEEGCVPTDPMADPVVLDLRGYPVRDPRGVAVVFLVGTVPAEVRERILTSVRVMR